jgi:ubiquinol-cytochrome c reductase iron-sulfur subunit
MPGLIRHPPPGSRPSPRVGWTPDQVRGDVEGAGFLAAERCALKIAVGKAALARLSGAPSRADAALCEALPPGIRGHGGPSRIRFEPLKDGMATVEQSDGTLAATADDGVRRRDFINIAAVSFAGVGALATLYPLINQMNPSADVLALASIEVDISQIQPGQAIKTMFRKQPLFIRHLTGPEIAAANAFPTGELRDPQSLAERTKPGKEMWLITMGVCTHLGCVPLGIGEGENRGPYGGYFCPCHGSAYDTAARIRAGPAPLNLQVPDYQFTSPTIVQIG